MWIKLKTREELLATGWIRRFDGIFTHKDENSNSIVDVMLSELGTWVEVQRYDEETRTSAWYGIKHFFSYSRAMIVAESDKDPNLFRPNLPNWW